MTKIIVDAALLAKLGNLTERLQLCTETGEVLATVDPVLAFSKYEPQESKISREELNRRFMEEKRFSTAEVISRLEKA